MPGDIVFDSEGGFRVKRPDGTFFPVPAEVVATVVVTLANGARHYDDYGTEFPKGKPLHDIVMHWKETEVIWSLIDRGNLMRMAAASEGALRGIDANAAAIRSLAAEVKKLNKELKDMMGFWKDLRSEYRRNRGEE